MLIEDTSTWEPLKATLKALEAGVQGVLKYIPNQGNAGGKSVV